MELKGRVVGEKFVMRTGRFCRNSAGIPIRYSWDHPVVVTAVEETFFNSNQTLLRDECGKVWALPGQHDHTWDVYDGEGQMVVQVIASVPPEMSGIQAIHHALRNPDNSTRLSPKAVLDELREASAFLTHGYDVKCSGLAFG